MVLQQDAEIVVGGGELGIERDRLAQKIDARVGVAARVAPPAEQEPGAWPLRRARKERA